jgi:DNA-binding transcriptional ArsR family regulator
MLGALLDGRALTVSELSRIAGVGKPATSEHVGRLLAGGLVEIVAQGRHRYVRLSSPSVAAALEALAVVSPPRPDASLRSSAAARALRPARLCYDHLAGELGVAIFDVLRGRQAIIVAGHGLELSADGVRWFCEAGVDPAEVEARRGTRPALRACLDWTERRDHLAGALLAALTAHWLDAKVLVRRAPGERGVQITDSGQGLLARLGVPLP